MERRDSVDADEVRRFSALASEWWDPAGPMAPLHRLNPLRLRWIREQALEVFGRDPARTEALTGLSLLDIGCGAGIAAEPLRRMGAAIVAIDPSDANITIAREHAALSGLSIDYRCMTAETLAASGESFDIVTALEVVEHVNDVGDFIATSASMLKPGGLLVAATINRTARAFLLAIVGAEYILRWLPRGTHQYEKLVKPEELEDAFRASDLTPLAQTGIVYIPIADEWRLSTDTGVNYMISARREA